MKLLLTGVLAFLVVGMAGTVRGADVTKDEVANLVKLKSEEKKVAKFLGDYPNPQFAVFRGGEKNYYIDIRAQLCFSQFPNGEGPVLVPCKALKKGYPLIAPLITWDD